MDIADLNISIDLFNTKEQMETFLSLAGFREHARYLIFKNFKGIVWSKTKDGQYALFLQILDTIDEYAHLSAR